ncbi:hypothetical protein B0H14DRAFT_2569033 [Mycena olivaceomarginata]|nr:hypothetical protein B0H14DRAFT_2569033 [Mycena olivaceomarginata]
MTKLYIGKYGRHLADNQDLEFDVPDPEDSAADEVVHEVLDEAEKEFCAEHLKTLRNKLTGLTRLVSELGAWYQDAYGNLLKSDQDAFRDLFSGVLDSAPPKPLHRRIIHFYSRMYYDTHIKQWVEARLEVLNRRSDASGEPMPRKIDVIAKVMSDVWEEETPAFQHECKVDWNAKEMAVTLENAVYYLQPFVDAIQQRFGMCASVLLCGPIGMRGGKIGLQSVHAGETRGVAPVTWLITTGKALKRSKASWSHLRRIVFQKQNAGPEQCQVQRKGPRHLDLAADERRGPVLTPMQAASLTPALQQASSTTTTTMQRATSMPATATQQVTSTPATATQQAMSDVRMEIDEEHGEHKEPRDGFDGERGTVVGEEYWRREDRSKWTLELGWAHAAFELGRGWGMEWSVCVGEFFDFKKRGAGGEDVSAAAGGGVAFEGKKVDDAAHSGDGHRTRQTKDLWVGLWWKWWESLQPEERTLLDNELSYPEQGEVAQKWGKAEIDDWRAAVDDVAWVLVSSWSARRSGAFSKRDDEPPPQKKRKGNTAAEKKNMMGDNEGADGADEDQQPRKKRRQANPGAEQEPRRALRFRKDGCQTLAEGATHGRSLARRGSKSNPKGKAPLRPKPKPLYKKQA